MRVQGKEGYLWYPTLAAMDMSLGLLRNAVHKRPYIAHIVLCMLFMTHLLRNNLGKYYNPMFVITSGLDIWPSLCHEYLIFTILFPFARR